MAGDVEVEFVRLEINTGFVMLGVAHTERKIDDPEGAAQAIMKARSALESAK
jgi:hypothetical protein